MNKIEPMTKTNINIPQTVRRLRERAGLSREALAKATGFKTGSGFQRYEDENVYPGGYLKRDLVAQLENALVGKGEPPISTGEIWALAGPEFQPRMNETSARPFDPSLRQRVAATGERLSFIREYFSLSIAEFANSIHVQPGEYAKWETGEDALPEYEAVTIYEVYGVSLDFLYAGKARALDNDLFRAWTSMPRKSTRTA